MAFCPEKAVRGTLLQKLGLYVSDLLDFVVDATDNFSRVSADWVYSNPHALPVLVNATGTFSKRTFKSELSLSNSSDRAISQRDSEKIARLFMHSDVEDRHKIESSIRTTSEGIVRDLLGKMLFESIVDQAMNDVGLEYVREAENRVLEGAYMAGRADFTFPNPECPKAFIEVRKSSSAHASLYANEKAWAIANWKASHPNLLGVLLYAGPWSKPALETLRLVYDYVIPVSESRRAADLIRAHVDGDPTIQRRRVKLVIEEC